MSLRATFSTLLGTTLAPAPFAGVFASRPASSSAQRNTSAIVGARCAEEVRWVPGSIVRPSWRGCSTGSTSEGWIGRATLMRSLALAPAGGAGAIPGDPGGSTRLDAAASQAPGPSIAGTRRGRLRRRPARWACSLVDTNPVGLRPGHSTRSRGPRRPPRRCPARDLGSCRPATEARVAAHRLDLEQVSKDLVAAARQVLAVDEALVRLANERARATRASDGE